MQGLITVIIYFISIFIPLTFTIINSELFEFPKFLILLSGTLVITVAWSIDMIYRRDYQLWSSDTSHSLKILHYSVLAILLTQGIATVFSINPYTSFWGYYSRFHGGLLTTICYTILYFATIKWMDKKSTQKLIKISLGTAFFVCIYGILEHFGIDKNLWKQDVQNRVFSTLGQPNWLAAYITSHIYLALYYFHGPRKRSTLIGLIVFLVYFTALIFTRSRSGLLALFLSAIVYLVLTLRYSSLTQIWKRFIPYSLIVITVLSVFGSAYNPSLSDYLRQSKSTRALPVTQAQGTSLETGGTESGDIRKIVWSGAIKLIKNYPLLGTGPETFGYTYYWVRPEAHNLTSEWDFLYNKAHNEYLNLATGAGLLGLTAYLFWHYAIFSLALAPTNHSKKVKNFESDELKSYLPILSASLVAFFVTNFFGFSVIPVYLVITLLSALASTLNRESANFSSDLPLGVYPLVTIVSIISLSLPIKIWLADYYYTIGKANLDKNKPDVAISYLEKSLKLRPHLDLFHSALSESYSLIATGLSLSKDEGLKAKVGTYTKLAIKESELTKLENKYHLNYYRSRAKVYLTLASLDPTFNTRAITELSEARALAPTDPKLAYNLGLVYTRINQLDKAEIQLIDSIKLKPNYPDPYYALTLLYEQTKQTTKIPPMLASAKANLATYSATLKDKIDRYVIKD